MFPSNGRVATAKRPSSARREKGRSDTDVGYFFEREVHEMGKWVVVAWERARKRTQRTVFSLKIRREGTAFA